MRLPKHPVPMTTVFRHCLLLNYAVAPDALAAALPAGLAPDLRRGRDSDPAGRRTGASPCRR